MSFNQGESFAFVHTLPRWGNALLSDSGADQFFVANCGTIHIGLAEAENGVPGGNTNIWYLRGSNVDTATPIWDEELVDVVGNNRLDFMQIVINGNGIPTLSYTKPGSEVTTASRNAPMPGDTSCGIIPVSVVSRKIHGGTLQADIILPLTGQRGVECRSPGQTGTAGVDYKVVFTFENDIVPGGCGTTSTPGGSVVAGPTAKQCTVNLTGISNAQYITVTLNGVVDSATGNVGNVFRTMGLLVGDVNGDVPNATGIVDSGDVFLVRQQAGQATTLSNFRKDINANGLIDSGDVFLTRQKTGSQLPSAP